MILLGIRGETIKYSSRKKKFKQKEEKILENEISKLENSISANLQNANIEEVNLLEEKKIRLKEIRANTLDGVIIRSHCRYEDLGENPSSYCFGLEKRNYTNKVITKIIQNDGHECTTNNEILNSQKTYYKTLYSGKCYKW